jgi:hypothetical protein
MNPEIQNDKENWLFGLNISKLIQREETCFFGTPPSERERIIVSDLGIKSYFLSWLRHL